MNSSNDNIHIALGIMQDKKVCVWALGRGACLKSKLHSPSQADHNWKPQLSVHSLCFGEANEGSTQYPYSNWSQTSGSLHGQLQLHSREKNRNWFGRQSSIISILLEFPLPSVVALILLS